MGKTLKNDDLESGPKKDKRTALGIVMKIHNISRFKHHSTIIHLI